MSPKYTLPPKGRPKQEEKKEDGVEYEEVWEETSQEPKKKGGVLNRLPWDLYVRGNIKELMDWKDEEEYNFERMTRLETYCMVKGTSAGRKGGFWGLLGGTAGVYALMYSQAWWRGHKKPYYALTMGLAMAGGLGLSMALTGVEFEKECKKCLYKLPPSSHPMARQLREIAARNAATRSETSDAK